MHGDKKIRTGILYDHSPHQSRPSIQKQNMYTANERYMRLGAANEQSLEGISFERSKVMHGYIVTDFAALVIGFALAWGLASLTHFVLFGHSDLVTAFNKDFPKIVQSLFLGLCVMFWFAKSGHYHLRTPFWTGTKKVVEAMGLAMLADIFLRFVVKQDFSRLWLLSGWMLATFGILGLRYWWCHIMRCQDRWDIPTLLVGGGQTAHDSREALASEPQLGYKIVGTINNLSLAFEQAGRSWRRLCATYNASHVVIALEGHELNAASSAFAQLLRDEIPFSVSPPLGCVPVLGMASHYFFNYDVILMTHSKGLNPHIPRLIKRVFDIFVSSLALILLSPLFIVIACLVKLEGGPILFGHNRLGLDGRTFACLKFRSMIPNNQAVLKKYLENNPEARKEWEQTHKLRNDPRITRLGHFLRRTSIDELPQLFNVLQGHMSIVGPRPIIVAETAKYDNDITHYYRVRPGITGLWQVSGRNDISYAKRVKMDSWYVRNWSLWHDIAIICKTVPAVLKRSGAY